MLTFLLQSICQAQKFFLSHSLSRDHIRHFRFAACDRSGLIQRNDLCLARLFQRDGCLEHNTVFRSHTVSDHDRHRGCKPECTRAADDKHGDSSRKRKSDRLSRDQPYDDRYQGEGASLGIVHADAIVVSLELNGEGYDFSGIDLADCVQIPFGAHQNHDVDSYPEQGLSTLFSDLESPLPEGWKESWVQTVSEFELVQPESENKTNRKGAANNKRKRKK